MYNTYDQQVYAVGKGPSCTTVSIQNDVVSLGNSVMIKGTVTEVSPGVTNYAIAARFPNGVPAISDDNMSEWMEYVYMQFPRPDATGVPVRLTAIGSSGNEIDVGWATSNDNGMFMKMWQPPAEGEYTIVATFGGTESYYGSTAETALGVTPAVTVSTPIEPEPTPEEPTPEEPTTPEQPTPEEPESEPTVETPLISAELAIIITIVAACIIGAVAYIALRRRK